LVALSLSLWFRSCGVRNCSRRATVRLGIDTLIANILVVTIFLIASITVYVKTIAASEIMSAKITGTAADRKLGCRRESWPYASVREVAVIWPKI